MNVSVARHEVPDVLGGNKLSETENDLDHEA